MGHDARSRAEIVMINHKVLDAAVRRVMDVGPRWMRFDLESWAKSPDQFFLREWISCEVQWVIRREYARLFRENTLGKSIQV